MLVEEQKYHPPGSGRLSPARSRGKRGEYRNRSRVNIFSSKEAQKIGNPPP
jgi:hypothetical protein